MSEPTIRYGCIPNTYDVIKYNISKRFHIKWVQTSDGYSRYYELFYQYQTFYYSNIEFIADIILNYPNPLSNLKLVIANNVPRDVLDKLLESVSTKYDIYQKVDRIKLTPKVYTKSARL